MVHIFQNGCKFQGSFSSFWILYITLYLYLVSNGFYNSYLILVRGSLFQQMARCCHLKRIVSFNSLFTGTHDEDIWRLSRSPGPHTEHQTWWKPRETHLLWDDQSPLQPAAFLWFHRLTFEQLGKSVMWNCSLSTLAAILTLLLRPTQQRGSSTLTLPKGVKHNYILYPNHKFI